MRTLFFDLSERENAPGAIRSMNGNGSEGELNTAA
jgi:hypothetical protein